MPPLRLVHVRRRANFANKARKRHRMETKLERGLDTLGTNPNISQSFLSFAALKLHPREHLLNISSQQKPAPKEKPTLAKCLPEKVQL